MGAQWGWERNGGGDRRTTGMGMRWWWGQESDGSGDGSTVAVGTATQRAPSGTQNTWRYKSPSS